MGADASARHPGTPGVLTLHFDPEGDLLEATRECEAAIFAHRFGDTRAALDRDFAIYEDACTFLALTDEAGEVVAQARFITPSDVGLKTLHEIARPPWSIDPERAVRAAGMDLEHTWDVATLGARPGSGGAGIRHAIALYHGVVQVCTANDVRGGTAIFDEGARALLAGVGLHYPPIPGTAPAPYIGSPSSVPVYVDVAAMLDRQRRTEPEAHRLVTLGTGLDGVVVPSREHFRLARDRISGGRSATASRTA